jgi:hypothetical protein
MTEHEAERTAAEQEAKKIKKIPKNNPPKHTKTRHSPYNTNLITTTKK